MIIIKRKLSVSSNNVKGYIVVKIEALRVRQLPEKYLGDIFTDTRPDSPRVYLEPSSTSVEHRNTLRHQYYNNPGAKLALPSVIFVEGEFYTCEQMNLRLDYVYRAAQRLHEINKERAQMEAEWQGEETIII